MDSEKKEKKERKGKKPFAKGDFRGKDRKQKEDKPYMKGKNDPSWRTNDAVMTKLVANLPFGLAAGLKQHLGNIDPSVTTEAAFTQPGIMVCSTYVTAGNSKDYNSALNLAFRKIYSFVRHANSGSKNYEAADMGVYFVAIGQIAAYLGFLQRLLRIVKEYSVTNRYLPTRLMRAMHVNPDDIISNQPQLKYLIAWLGRTLGGLAFPEMNYFKACYESFKYVYRDNDSPKEQFYLLNPHAFGLYDPLYTSNGGGVDYDAITWPDVWSATPLSYVDLYNIAKRMTDVLLGDEDCGIISGDILKAFRDHGLMKLEAFGEDYDVFLHSPEFLQQIHNLTIVPDKGIHFAGYAQDPGTAGTAPYVVQDLRHVTTGYTAPTNMASRLCIDAFSRDPDPLEVVNCTVLNPQFKVKDVGTGGAHEYVVDEDTLSFDLFLPTNVEVYSSIDASDAPYLEIDRLSKSFDSLFTQLTINEYDMSNFDWHPIMLFINGATNPWTVKVFGDIQNFRIFDYDIGVRIHDNSMLGLLNFSEVNFYQK